MATKGRETLETLSRTLFTRLLGGAAAFALLLVALAVALTGHAVDTQVKLQSVRLDELGSSSASFGAQIAAPFVEFDQPDEVRRVAAQMLASTPGARFAAVTTVTGSVVAAMPPGFIPSTISEPTDEIVGSARVRHFFARIPSKSGDGHRFHIGIDRNPIETEIAELRNASLVWTMSALVIGVGFTAIGFLWIIRLARQLSTVTEGMKANDSLIAQTAQELHASAAEIHAVAKRTEEHAADEAAAVDETRRTMRALLESANDIAESARAVAEIAQETSGATSVTAERIATLNAQAIRIGDVSEAIQSIADKSELLALNAALEGARAGEDGRGFVLVAAEMRRLTESVMNAAHEIKQLSAEIRELSQSAVLATEQSEKLSTKNSETARRITLITSQQRSATEQVTQSMDEIQEYTQQALSGAKQAKSTAADLARTSEGLTRTLGAS
ncbi:MAG: hypothetical protein HY791_29190 [Deltaproteobacteria bacterium]|nr:hypothetical protein [Deltaproteobacteria bacterium]